MTDEQFAQIIDLLREIRDAVKQPPTLVVNNTVSNPRVTADAVVQALDQAARGGALHGSHFARAVRQG